MKRNIEMRIEITKEKLVDFRLFVVLNGGKIVCEKEINEENVIKQKGTIS